jgi:O-antigen/teichoic acid export membrane protein
MTGTGLAQALPIALSPILTRLYKPEDFGVFALYASICAILAALVTGKYDLAIVVPKRDSEAINLMALTLTISLVVSAVFLTVVLIWAEPIANFLEHPEIQPWLYFIPATTATLGCYHALNFWANRCTRYKGMAASRVIQSSASGITQLAAGVSKLGSSGLILGQLLGQVISTLFLAFSIPRKERHLFRRISVKRMIWAARKHMKYPKYMVPGQTMSVGSAELPLLLLTVFFGAGVAGFYSLAQRVMAAPLSIVANAIGDVYRQKAAEQYAMKGECHGLFSAALKRLGLFALLPILPVVLFGPALFALVFGENWRPAGEIAILLSVLVFFQTVSSPLSSTVLLAGWLRLEFFWQLSRLVLAVLVFYAYNEVGANYFHAIIAHVIVYSSLYILHLFWQQKAARGLAK